MLKTTYAQMITALGLLGVNNILRKKKMADNVQKFVDDIRQKFGADGPKVILDVGSRDIEESIQLSRAFPNARVIAFEPNPNQYPICYMRSTVYPMIEVHDYAITDVEGPIDFYIVGANHGGSSLLEPIDVPYSDGTHQKVTVKGRRLDSILPELGVDKVDVIWMDVQGNELKALQGMGRFIDDVKIMHTEACPNAYYVGHILKDEFEAWLLQQGFNVIWEPTIGHKYGEGDLLCIRP